LQIQENTQIGDFCGSWLILQVPLTTVLAWSGPGWFVIPFSCMTLSFTTPRTLTHDRAHHPSRRRGAFILRLDQAKTGLLDERQIGGDAGLFRRYPGYQPAPHCFSHPIPSTTATSSSPLLAAWAGRARADDEKVSGSMEAIEVNCNSLAPLSMSRQ
jgi:hypothetical protein